jgi:fructose-1,6-bisphosphatase/inositol monophosphatase family enzyme
MVVPPDSRELAAATVRVLGDSALRSCLAAAGHAVAARLPTWDQAAAVLLEAYEGVVQPASARA